MRYGVIVGSRDSRLRVTVLLLVLTWFPVLAQSVSAVVAPTTAAPEEDPAGSSVLAAPERTSSFHLERQPVAGGAELITLFGRLDDPSSPEARLDVPLLSVLRDTLGDSEVADDRLRYIWILTRTRPTPLQRLASAFSIICFRTGGKRHANQVPAPVLDMASPGKTVWSNLLANSLQATELDPMGKLVRSSTRSYRGNYADYQKLQTFQTLGALEALTREDGTEPLLPESDFRSVYSRLSLSDRTLGGLVRPEKLGIYFDKENTRRRQVRGQNWEMLRQRAELNGLYFEPLALPDSDPSEALLWVSREDLGRGKDQPFDAKFLNLADPWTDDRLEHWNGYTETRYLDAENRAVSADTPGARPVEMIPLALYSLDYPRVPLLLADFRDTYKPKRKELVRHGTSTLLTGVFGITRMGNLAFFGASSAWNFVNGRRGATVNRSARLQAYSEAREFVALDTTLDLRLKSEMLRRLDHLALNPLENHMDVEATLAREQFAALLRYAQSQDGLPARLERDRRRELAAYTKPRILRILAGVGHLFSSGPSGPPEEPGSELNVQLASYRRALRAESFLNGLLASSPRPDVVSNTNDVLQSIDDLSAYPRTAKRSANVIAQVFARSSDAALRFACLRALRRSNGIDARNELWRLSLNEQIDESWRAICLQYFHGDVAPGAAMAPGGAL